MNILCHIFILYPYNKLRFLNINIIQNFLYILFILKIIKIF